MVTELLIIAPKDVLVLVLLSALLMAAALTATPLGFSASQKKDGRTNISINSSRHYVVTWNLPLSSSLEKSSLSSMSVDELSDLG